MARRRKDVETQDEAKRQEVDRAVQDLQVLLTEQTDPRLQDVKVWVNRINDERGVVYLGLSLGEALGCSPFCGCAAKQIGDQFEPYLMERVPWMVRVVAEAEAPPENAPGNLLLRLM